MTQQSYSWVYMQHTCTPVFISGLFTIAKIWKKPKCPPTDEWIKRGDTYFSVIKRTK